MSITAKNILQHEIIGQEVEITKSTNKSLEGIKGKITDETQNTITMQSNHKTKIMPKNQITLTFKINGEKIEVEGKYFQGKPEDRIKK